MFEKAITNKQQINNMASSTKEKSILQGRVKKNYKESASTNIAFPSNFLNIFNTVKITLLSWRHDVT